MKIVFIGQKGIPALSGGIERHVDELATRLAKNGHEVFVYCRSHYTPKNKKQYKGVNLIHLPSFKTKHLDAITHTLLVSLDVLRRDVDVIHYHGIGPASLLWIPKLLKRKAKIFFTFHCQDYFHQKWGRLARFYLRLGEYVGCHFADSVITISKTLQKYTLVAYQCQASYIPNGIDKAKILKPDLITQKWNLHGDDYILAVSRLVRHKGLQHLIRAYNKLNLSQKLVIVGSGAYTDDYVTELKELAEGNPNIIFTGEQKGYTLQELYSNAYCFVQPSEAEGLSIALLEALSYSRAVLASDIIENAEVIEPNSEKKGVGILFTNKDVNDLASKLQRLCNQPKQAVRLGENAQKYVNDNYHWNKSVKLTQKLYQAQIKEAAKSSAFSLVFKQRNI